LFNTNIKWLISEIQIIGGIGGIGGNLSYASAVKEQILWKRSLVAWKLIDLSGSISQRQCVFFAL